MITFEQAQRGIIKYVDAVVLPHMGGAKRLAAGVYLGLGAQNIKKMLQQYKNHPVLQFMDIIVGEDKIDDEKLYKAMIPYFNERLHLDIPILGHFSFDRNDLDNLFAYMRG